jgi:DNA-binding NtrC family response regulator
MRLDLHTLGLLEFRPDEGTIYLKDERMMLLSAAAYGNLKKQVIESFGIDVARRLFWQVGYTQGYQDYLSIKQLYGKDFADNAGPRLYAIVGLGAVEMLVNVVDNARESFHMETIAKYSMEAEQYLQHFGKADQPVCWTTIGYASGYESARVGREVYYKEVMCKGRGDECCRLLALDAAGWGPEIEELRKAHLPVHAGCNHGTEALREEMRSLCELMRKQRQEVDRRTQRDGSDQEREAERGLCSQALQLANKDNFIVRGPVMIEVLAQAICVAHADTTVLVCGETGTGKEFISHLIHQQSARAKQPLLSVNCAALTETLLESELFGHVRGAFTGAVTDKAGLFEAANDGTLFLDEIGEMGLALQAKMLRTLENGEVRRVGSNRTIKVNTRIIAATNRDLLAEIAAGRFRQDLFYRLNSFVIQLPPLRENQESIPPLIGAFLQQSNNALHKQVTSITPEAMSALMNYSWPGNVRELKHAMERSVLVARGRSVRLLDLPLQIAMPAAPSDSEHTLNLKENEKQFICMALEQTHGNRKEAAHTLNISLSTLWRKMKLYGLSEQAHVFSQAM